MRAPRLTLVQVYAVSAAAVAVLLAAMLGLFLAASRRSILESAEALRDAAARRIESLVLDELHGAARAVADLERDVRLGIVDPDDAKAIESALFAALARNDHLAEVTFTCAHRTGFDGEGYPVLEARPRWQVSLVRTDKGVLVTRSVRAGGGRDFSLAVRERPEEGGLLSAPLLARGSAPDPTAHDTFQVAASRDFDGKPIWTDLSYAQSDAGMPEAERRIVVTVQKSIVRRSDRFAGVLRAGLLTAAIDQIPSLRVDDRVEHDPHRIFLADSRGRLVTRTASSDPLVDRGDALRVSPRQPSAVLSAALASPLLGEAARAEMERSGEMEVAGERHLLTFRPLPGTQDWLVGIAVRESAYTSSLEVLRRKFLGASALVAVAILLGGGATLVALRRGLFRIVSTTARMRDLDFAAAPAEAPFRDVQQVMDGLERAKTALRALGKYVPVDLVRQLYRKNIDPVPGGESRELTILFTDLEGFTTLAERLSPAELAEALGAYLHAMTVAIREAGGTIDKFIGDAVMAFWNAPEPQENEARLACAAVLACKDATSRLYDSPAWKVPRLRTRFGLNRGEVVVGNFGSPERLNYTALGDAVNLASRLESLCKQYGVDVLAAESVVTQVRDEFTFRVVDRVAVKGRRQGVLVYELLGHASAAVPGAVREYETAFAAYSAGDFAAAIRVLERNPEDAPSRVLLERCRLLASGPLPAGWNGVYVATAK
jgi:adenylate cyclase